jgi:hypothetical protein
LDRGRPAGSWKGEKQEMLMTEENIKKDKKQTAKAFIDVNPTLIVIRPRKEIF